MKHKIKTQFLAPPAGTASLEIRSDSDHVGPLVQRWCRVQDARKRAQSQPRSGSAERVSASCVISTRVLTVKAELFQMSALS